MSIISTSAPRLRLPDQVNIDFGPAELLGPAFLQLDRAARDSGIYLSVSHDMAALAEVNAKNRKDWYRLSPAFNADLGGIDEMNGFWVSGSNQDGEIVMTQAARLYLWPDTSFIEEWENRTLLYADPATQAEATERCTVDCPAAAKLTGRVGHTGALWVRSDQRNNGLVSVVQRVTRAYALTRWYPDYMFGLAKENTKLSPRSLTRLYGWHHVDRSVQWYGSTPLGDVDCVLCWMDRKELVEDIAQFTDMLSVPTLAQAA